MALLTNACASVASAPPKPWLSRLELDLIHAPKGDTWQLAGRMGDGPRGYVSAQLEAARGRAPKSDPQLSKSEYALRVPAVAVGFAGQGRYLRLGVRSHSIDTRPKGATTQRVYRFSGGQTVFETSGLVLQGHAALTVTHRARASLQNSAKRADLVLRGLASNTSFVLRVSPYVGVLRGAKKSDASSSLQKRGVGLRLSITRHLGREVFVSFLGASDIFKLQGPALADKRRIGLVVAVKRSRWGVTFKPEAKRTEGGCAQYVLTARARVGGPLGENLWGRFVAIASSAYVEKQTACPSLRIEALLGSRRSPFVAGVSFYDRPDHLRELGAQAWLKSRSGSSQMWASAKQRFAGPRSFLQAECGHERRVRSQWVAVSLGVVTSARESSVLIHAGLKPALTLLARTFCADRPDRLQ